MGEMAQNSDFRKISFLYGKHTFLMQLDELYPTITKKNHAGILNCGRKARISAQSHEGFLARTQIHFINPHKKNLISVNS